jgi:Divergent InlB B-repeat domain
MAFATAVFSESNAEMSGTDEKRSPAPNGTLRVSRGRATGNGAPGNQVTVTADAAPAGEQFAGWTGDAAVLADRFSSTTTAMVPFTAATVAATFTPVTASKSVPKHVRRGNVLPPTNKPNGYSLSDIARATAFFSTSGPDNRSEATEPNVPFQILYDSNINDPHNTFCVQPDATFYVPIFYSDDSPPITGNFPDVTDQKAVEKYLSSHKELGAEFIEIEVDGKVTPIKKHSGYAVGVMTEPLPDGGGTHYVTVAVFLTPFLEGTHAVTIRAKFTGDAVGGIFEYEIPYTVIVNK